MVNYQILEEEIVAFANRIKIVKVKIWNITEILKKIMEPEDTDYHSCAIETEVGVLMRMIEDPDTNFSEQTKHAFSKFSKNMIKWINRRRTVQQRVAAAALVRELYQRIDDLNFT